MLVQLLQRMRNHMDVLLLLSRSPSRLYRLYSEEVVVLLRLTIDGTRRQADLHGLIDVSTGERRALI